MGNLGLFLLDFQVVQGVLLLDFHQDPPELDALIEILEDLFFDAFDFLPLFDPSAMANLSLLAYEMMRGVDGYNKFTLIVSWFILKFEFELVYFLPEVIDDILVLADVYGNKFLIGNCLGLDVLCTVGVL